MFKNKCILMIFFLLNVVVISSAELNTEDLDSIELYCTQAKKLGYSGEYKNGIDFYNKVLKINPDHREALMGKGRLQSWSGLPYSAIKTFKKVLKTNKEDKEALAEIEKLKKIFRIRASFGLKYIEELEEEKSLTKSSTPLQEYSLTKRLGNYLDLGLAAVIDESERHYINKELDIDTLLKKKLVDNLMGKMTISPPIGKFYLHGGWSYNESQFTTLGLAYNFNKKFATIQASNTLKGGYEYFYHWNNIGKHYVADAIRLDWKSLTLNVELEVANVREFRVFDISDNKTDSIWHVGINPYKNLKSSIHYKLLKKPSLDVLGGIEYADYKFGSNLYYTPHKRSLIFAGFNISGNISRFQYGADLKGGIDDGGTELNDKAIETKNFYDVKANIGWDFGLLLLDLGGRVFVNQAYEAKIIHFKLVY